MSCPVCHGVDACLPDCDLIVRPVELRDYCGNCWESLTDGAHLPDQACTEPTAPLSYTELRTAMMSAMIAGTV